MTPDARAELEARIDLARKILPGKDAGHRSMNWKVPSDEENDGDRS